MGRSREGLTTKIHALTDANGLPLELGFTPGQAAECPPAAKLLGGLRAFAVIMLTAIRLRLRHNETVA